jgi:hypothetical protein
MFPNDFSDSLSKSITHLGNGYCLTGNTMRGSLQHAYC